MRYLFAIIISCLACYHASAMDTSTQIFNSRVKSLQVQIAQDPYAPPVICLGTDDRLVISFDHLAEDRTYLRYEVLHCNADWQPSMLVESEYLDGFNFADVELYDFSQLTTTHYVHYTIVIPNEQMALFRSGNYLLKVYPESDPDDTWLQCRFMVTDQTAVIGATLSTATDVDFNDKHQQIAVTVDTERASVTDPFNDLTVVIKQNGRNDNQVILRQPLRMSGRKVSVYEHVPALVFDAGNEYRRFETVSTTYPGMGVEGISYSDPYYHFTLARDTERASSMYLYDQTQHGRYRVREYNSDQSDIEADYAVVHFSLDIPEIHGAKVYLDGDFTDRRFSSEALMTYNHARGCYERNLLLKQGAYNYQYLVVPDGSSKGLTGPIEGDKYQTVNEYTIYVYARSQGERADRLIGVSQISN